jgi:glutamate--cysteine ligase
VLLVPRDGGGWHVAPGITFAEWLAGAPALPRPTAADLDRHLSTLFPPVRPRGRWFEVRCLDALPEPYWRVPVAVVSALLDDPAAADAARAAVEPLASRPDAVRVAARDGLTDGDLRAAAGACFAATLDALPRLRADAALVGAVADYAERYVARGRCPADDDDALLSPAPLEVSL